MNKKTNINITQSGKKMTLNNFLAHMKELGLNGDVHFIVRENLVNREVTIRYIHRDDILPEDQWRNNVLCIKQLVQFTEKDFENIYCFLEDYSDCIYGTYVDKPYKLAEGQRWMQEAMKP